MTCKELSLLTIGDSSLFNKMDRDQLKQIQKISKLYKVQKGTELVVEGQAGDELYLVLQGNIHVEKLSKEGEKRLVAKLGKGDVIGELVLFGTQVRSATAYAAEYAEFLSFKGHDLRELFGKESLMGYRFMDSLSAILAERMVRTTTRLADVS